MSTQDIQSQLLVRYHIADLSHQSKFTPEEATMIIGGQTKPKPDKSKNINTLAPEE